MTISVIIPVYNSSLYLSRCLDSVLLQTYDDLEIVLVDDGSTDGSEVICDEYARNNDVIIVYHTENQGASMARRLGIEKARGEYICFVDSDDYVMPDYLSTLYDLEEMFNLGLSACGVRKIISGESIEITSFDYEKSVVLKGDELFHRFFKYEFWGLWGKLYRKSLLMDITFPQATLNEDYYVMARLLCKTGKMAYSSKPLYSYEQRSGSLSRQSLSEKSFEEYENVKSVYDFTLDNMPQYEEYAFFNVVETVVKLLMQLRHASPKYKAHQQELKSFLSSHKRQILSCKPLNRKTAILALLLMI